MTPLYDSTVDNLRAALGQASEHEDNCDRAFRQAKEELEAATASRLALAKALDQLQKGDMREVPEGFAVQVDTPLRGEAMKAAMSRQVSF